MNGYPSGFTLLLRLAFLAVILSGILLVPNALDMRLGWSVPWSLSSGARTWFVSSHAASYYLCLLLVGALWTVHMRAGWLRRENIISGMALISALALLALSGLLLYYAGEDNVVNAAVLAHIGVGLLLPTILMAHIFGARRAKARAVRPTMS
jgi:hypothetical protein